jgi:Gametolysin peptidase M11/NPCBM-associated, NEW3 domain of alpha-galactosidase
MIAKVVQSPFVSTISSTVASALLLCAAAVIAPLHLATAAPVSDAAVPITGTLQVVYGDDFLNKRSERLYFVEDKLSGESYQVHLSRPAPANVAAGRQVTVRGRVSGKHVYLAAGEELTLAAAGSLTAGSDTQASTTAVTGDQATLVVVADFKDAAVSCPVTTIRDTMFTDPNNQSIDDLFRETSQGQLSLSGKVVGPFKIDAASTDTCDVNAWSTAADAAAQSAGVDLNGYQRRVYVIPSQNTCGYTGLGTIGGSPGKAWIMRCDLPAVYGHEIGHTLGMNHAATSTNEYGDTSDIMGSEMSGLRQLNAAHQKQMGWRAPESFVDVTKSGTYLVAPIELGAASAVAPQALRIAKPDTGETYYIGYRQPIGFDANLNSQLTSRVQVHRYNDAGGRTWYLSGLLVGSSFSDTVNGITITNLSLTPDYATVQVQFASDATCARAAPTVTASPASQTVAAGATASVAVSVTNKDSAACAAATFNVAAVAPSGWTASPAPTAIALAPGGTGQTTLSIASPGTTPAGTYNTAVNVSDASVAAHNASVTATVVVQDPCVRSVPGVALTPASQSGTAGQTLQYVANISNLDSAACPATTFAVAGAVPSGWAGVISGSSLTLSPGQSAQSGLSVSSPSSVADGSYAVAVSAANAGGTNLVTATTGSYQVFSNTDSVAPTAPGGLAGRYDSKRYRISLSWIAASDNVGVVAYRIYRDTAYLGQTTTTAYVDGAVTAGTTYSYYVTAVDAAGNVSPASGAVAVSTGTATAKRRVKEEKGARPCGRAPTRTVATARYWQRFPLLY